MRIHALNRFCQSSPGDERIFPFHDVFEQDRPVRADTATLRATPAAVYFIGRVGLLPELWT